MSHCLALTALIVREYNEAIEFYVNTLGFRLVEDTDLSMCDNPGAGKRWVVVSPAGPNTGGLLLARAEGEDQLSRVGNQTGGRVFLFLNTDDLWRDYRLFLSRGVNFIDREPRREAYGLVAVFQDLYGNLLDLIQPIE